MKNIIVTILLLFFPRQNYAQDSLFLSLNQALEMAEKNSLDAFRNKNMYLASYWEFRSYKASRLPSLDLNLRPVDFNRTTIKRYDSQQDIEVYREQQIYESYANLSFTQNIPLTGAKIYIDSDLSRLVNVGDIDLTTYRCQPWGAVLGYLDQPSFFGLTNRF